MNFLFIYDKLILVAVMQEKIFDLNNCIDFTLLDPRATIFDLEKLCNIAYKNKYYSVCVNPTSVSFVKGYILKNLSNELKVCCVVGFPLGANVTDIKCAEAKQAIVDGADEIDFVINISKLKENNLGYLKNELSKMRKVTKNHIIKCIIETAYLTEIEIVRICKLCVKYKIDYVKTSTGFATSGAKIKDVKIMLNAVDGKCLVKASGGIKTRESAIEFLNMGANRIGTSRVL